MQYLADAARFVIVRCNGDTVIERRTALAGSTMNIQQQEQTWHGFMKFVQYTAGGAALILILMAIFLA